MSNNATLRQAIQTLKIIDQTGAPRSQIQEVFKSGILSDVFKAYPSNIDRALLQEALGLKPREPKTFPVMVKDGFPSPSSIREAFGRVDKAVLVALMVALEERTESLLNGDEYLRQMSLASFTEPREDTEIPARIAANGMCIADFLDLLGYVRLYPKTYLKHEVVVLGTHIRLHGGTPYGLVVRDREGVRSLEPLYLERLIPAGTKILVVQK